MGVLDWNFKKLMSYLKSASSNLLTWNLLSKNKKTLNLGPKIPYLSNFGLQFGKSYYQIFNQYSRICGSINFHPKQKKLRTKNSPMDFGLECSKTDSNRFVLTRWQTKITRLMVRNAYRIDKDGIQRRVRPTRKKQIKPY